METVYAIALWRPVVEAEPGEALSQATEIQGLRIGLSASIGTPSEVSEATENDERAAVGTTSPGQRSTLFWRVPLRITLG
jgi:hypothetical protein